MKQPRRASSPTPTNQSGDGGFTNPQVFDTIEEAIAAGTSEDRYLDSLDRTDPQEPRR